MKKIELNMRMADAETLIENVAYHITSLLSESALEIETALDILQDFDDPRAEKFLIRHSTPKEGAPLPESISDFMRPVTTRMYITGETVTRKNG